MKNHAAAAALLIVLATVSALAQQPKRQFFKPGDTVRITVTFDKPTKIETGDVTLGLPNPAGTMQKGFESSWRLANFTPNENNTEYEFFGTVPEGVNSGLYEVRWIHLKVDGIGAEYYLGTDYQSEIKLEVKNEKKTPLPQIQGVRGS